MTKLIETSMQPITPIMSKNFSLDIGCTDDLLCVDTDFKDNVTGYDLLEDKFVLKVNANFETIAKFMTMAMSVKDVVVNMLNNKDEQIFKIGMFEVEYSGIRVSQHYDDAYGLVGLAFVYDLNKTVSIFD